MKNFLNFIGIIFLLNSVAAQKGTFEVESFHLSNGMKVLLCEDHTKPEIYGGILVHAGSRHDPPDHTGMAHYFEHIMFKGTDKIGTLDWEKEKPYLDSISDLYDRLHSTEIAAERVLIQDKINELSIRSAQYAIPNEVSLILSKMGGYGINAYTSTDETVYHTIFPSNQLEKWMEVYAERFRNPVFRLFQSELETVYEEKNMYADNPMMFALEDLQQSVFGNHPYGRPIIGYSEHLKSPRISKMKEFVDTYYVANNMTLILVGDLNPKEVRIMAEKTFGTLRSHPLLEEISYDLPQFKGRVEINRRMTPVKIGVLGYQTCTPAHEDYRKVELLAHLFTNRSSTGLLDKLSAEDKLLSADLYSLAFKEFSAFGFLYVPKILGQSLDKAEKYVMDCIDSVRTGHFSERLFQAVKMEYMAAELERLESLGGKFRIMTELDLHGLTYGDYMDRLQQLQSLTKADMVVLADRYLGDDYLVYRSRMGFPKKDKIKKPDWKPVNPQNSDSKSEFARKIDNMAVSPISPQQIDIGTDVIILPLLNDYKLYTSANPYNDIFTLDLLFDYGILHNPHLENAISYFSRQGTETKSYEEFNLSLQELGARMTLSAFNERCRISIQGFEKDLEKILLLCSEKMRSPGNDENMLSLLIEERRMDYRLRKRDPAFLSACAFQFAVYGEKSVYLEEPPLNRVKRYTGTELLDIMKSVFQTTGFVTYVGSLSAANVKDIIIRHLHFPENARKTDSPIREPLSYGSDQLFYLPVKSLQSNVYFHVKGEKYGGDADRVKAASFNQYFGGGMYAIVFQEIREFRSLAYSAGASFNYSWLNKTPGNLTGRLTTQSDKTTEAVEVMKDLVKILPERPEKFIDSKEALLSVLASDYIAFRRIPLNVYYWIEQGYGEDPRPGYIRLLREIDFQDMGDFHRQNIAGRPVITVFSGNTKRMNKKRFGLFGNVTKLRISDILKK